MYTAAAERTITDEQRMAASVYRISHLVARGMTHAQIDARIAALRWQRYGRAIVTHRGTLTRPERWEVALANCEPGAGLASFTALESQGLTGWERDDVHLIGSAGARRPPPLGFDVRLHRTAARGEADLFTHRRVQRPAAALLLAASNFSSVRPAMGLLAAGVQQRLIRPESLLDEVAQRPRIRHRHHLLMAAGDIAGGSEALGEIDFVRLCRRSKLPEPEQQVIRNDSGGRRRYLDATFRRSDGRTVIAEIDGAIHLVPKRWFDDQLRQNELVLGDAVLLRYPSFIVRTEPALVAGQLRRALQ